MSLWELQNGKGGFEGASASGNLAKKTGVPQPPGIGPQTNAQAQQAQQVDEAARKGKVDRALACGTGALFTATFGIRLAQVILMGKAQADACNNVNKHLSGSPSTTPSSTPSSIAIAGVSPGSGPGGGSSPQLSGSSTGVMESSGGSKDDAISDCFESSESVRGCLKARSGEQSNAKDEELLNNSGNLDTLLGRVGDPNELLKLATTAGAGAAMASLLPASMGSLGEAVANIAQHSQEHATKLAPTLGVSLGSTYYGGGGAPTDPGAGAIDTTPSGSFGLGKMGASGPSISSFGNGIGNLKAYDIWHTNSKKTIFDIVSGKVGEVKTRVKGDSK